MKNFLKRLKDITKDCSPDMHEPDGQGLEAMVVGNQLDNAMGEQITIDIGFQEYVVVLRKDGITEKFNLATLIALAKKAKL